METNQGAPGRSHREETEIESCGSMVRTTLVQQRMRCTLFYLSIPLREPGKRLTNANPANSLSTRGWDLDPVCQLGNQEGTLSSIGSRQNRRRRQVAGGYQEHDGVGLRMALMVRIQSAYDFRK
jgi:hypothetical protein